jgi:site-specific DNA-methyltransferase (adenine-specific)
MACRIEDAGFEIRDMIAWVYGSGFPKSHNLKDEWQGWGTALKPALEPITMARKPLIGTVAENVLEHGTGALNIDKCRVGTDESTVRTVGKTRSEGWGLNGQAGQKRGSDVGRWPANLIHDGSDEVIDLVGSAARFFYCPKASKSEREAGLEEMESVYRVNGNKWTDQDYRVTNGERPQSAESGPRKNIHPTVKPIDLMAYLCRLITPPKGTILDPFTGSGSTGIAALRSGFAFIGIELNPEYAQIAKQRLSAEKGLFND